MAQTTERPKLATARLADPTPANLPAVWDLEIYHAMEKRDEALIHDELLNGSASSAFVYSFQLNGKTVAGISVVGARHLASEYGGIKHRLVASAEKRGALFTFTSYPAEGVEMRVNCAVVPELEHEPDFYRIVVEVQDVKSGNSIQVERQEARLERRAERNRGGGAGEFYERPNYATIAQSKAFRNGVLSLIPQDVQIPWKKKMLSLPQNQDITESVIAEKRSAVLRFAASKAIPLARERVEQLTLDQITGLGDAARDENAAAFAQAAQALWLVPGAEPVVTEGAAQQTATVSEDKPAQDAGELTGEAGDQKPADPKKAAAKPKDEKPKEAEQAKPAAAGREPRFEV